MLLSVWGEMSQLSVRWRIASEAAAAVAAAMRLACEHQIAFSHWTDLTMQHWYNQRRQYHLRYNMSESDIPSILDILLRDATQSAVMPQSVRPSVRLSVTFRYRDHIGWHTSKIITRPHSLRLLLGLTPTWAIWCNGNTPKLRWNRGGVTLEQNKSAISPKPVTLNSASDYRANWLLSDYIGWTNGLTG